MRAETHKHRDEKGFTIIEVVFFLAISGGLVVALLGTVGLTISRQRFTDSVTSLQAFLQTQYNATVNVANSRQTGSCGAGSGGTTSTGVGTDSPRGASNCVILGRAIDFNPSAKSPRITVRNIVGVEPTAAAAADLTGADLIKLYNPGVDENSVETYDVPWDAGVIGLTPEGVSRILLIRSPDSGLVLSFGGGNGASLIPSLDDSGRVYNVCVRSADITSAVSAVSLQPLSGSEAVQTKFDLNMTDRGTLCGV